MSEQVTAATPVIVVLPPEIDVTNSEHVFGLLSAAMTSGVSLIIADMTTTIFCDTSGMRALVHAHEQAGDSGIELRFAISVSGSVRRVLELTGIIRLLPVYPTLQEAVDAR